MGEKSFECGSSSAQPIPSAQDAYAAACRIVDRDGALGIEAEGIIDNVLAELAKLAGVP